MCKGHLKKLKAETFWHFDVVLGYEN